MKKTVFSGLVAAALVVTFVSGASAFGRLGTGQRSETGRRGFMKEKIAKEIGLTQQQKQKFLEREQSIDKKILGLRQEKEKMHLWLRQELKKDSPDKKAINRTIEKIGSINTGIQKERTEYILWMREQLTTEQKAKMDSCFEHNRSRADGSRRKARGR